MYTARFTIGQFAQTCNWPGLTQGHVYGALQRLHSVLNVPEPKNAFQRFLQVFYASFYDYLLLPSWSGPFCVIAPEIIQCHILQWICILPESHSVGLIYPGQQKTKKSDRTSNTGSFTGR
ncbi:hypothetical protein P691DRAFT_769367 [Macrolepiota fuliginosa MF-IS2]|uniref:Uncharacterized protein n=1 Tax=Macrolepiota fuliginosa MF-IS2 TaxID=1400762 RepID=A0A9P6BUC3_9AGAR|nr:hypothetical protein P691DRAFT_769367 [Macrolepiota fuliginosa MF-IS2]